LHERVELPTGPVHQAMPARAPQRPAGVRGCRVPAPAARVAPAPTAARSRRIALLVSVFLCSSPRVSAQESVEALVSTGVELRRQGRDEEARDVFERAHALAPSARTRAQVALADQALGRWVAAEVGLEEALTASADPWVTRNEASLRAALERARDALGTLRVALTEPTTAEVRLDGRPLAQEAMFAGVRTPAGTHQLELRAGERLVAEQRVVVPPRGEVVVKLGETPSPHAPSVAPAGAGSGTQLALELPATRSPAAGAAAQSLGQPASAEPERADGVPRWLGWTSAVMAGGLLTTGVVAHVESERSAARYNDDARCFFGDMTRDQRCSRERTRSETAAAIAVGGYALGALALGGALTLLLWPDPEPTPSRHVACIDVQLGAGSGYVATRLSF